MILPLLASLLLAPPIANLQEVPFTSVDIQDQFWRPRQETNRTVTVAHSLGMLEETGDLKNFDLAAAGARKGFQGFVFQDSDVYKVIEAASYTLATHPDPVLSKKLDTVISRVAAAQMADGYLNTYYQVNEPDRRFTNLRDNHEMYCAGHLMEGAVAHFRATGKRNFLNVATKLADHLCNTFGDGPGKRPGYCGHPEIELALVKLWRVTNQRRYFDLAKYFIDHRGSKFFADEHKESKADYDGTYWQDEVPIRDLTTMVGHAVRAGYLLSGVTDITAVTGDQGMISTLKRVWKNTNSKRTYITGGIGSSGANEGFTTDYDLPNLTAYQESCASVAMSMWSHRMNLLTGEAKYADAMETSLYNGMLAGYSLDGKLFFYGNPLESRGGYHRSKWFGCACCPPNESRTIAALGGYGYAVSSNSLYVNLYLQGIAKTSLATLDVQTNYPWDGLVQYKVHPVKPRLFSMRFRVPAWAPATTLAVNGKSIAYTLDRGYAVLTRRWKDGDRVDLSMPMPVRRVAANPNVKDDLGSLAIARGPLVYCLEGADNKANVSQVAIPAEAVLRTVRRPDLLGGIVTIVGTGKVSPAPTYSPALYQTAPTPKDVPVVAIPYYAWDNRANGPMKVWIPTTPAQSGVPGLAGEASVSLSFTSGNCQPWGINDGNEPKSSLEQNGPTCHWWPHKGGSEWAQYTWKTPHLIDSSEVYWFDDTGRGECRLPASWSMEYLSPTGWKPLAIKFYSVSADKWCRVEFPAVSTTALRLNLKMQDKWAAGIHEWKVGVAED